ncbi:MAG: 50S ribosomal protein L23 [Pseudomonadales bacterium]|nr:50S ribosomal protein L23 [Pseudomonadales bacterium]NIX08823.1 50S ribosomal protein L23 [Pseudomonadales bacterium]
MNQERLYTVLLEPHFSEKVAILGDRSNQYGFKVAKDATKDEIKQAVEQLFKVTVENVSTMNVKGKVKRTVRGLSRGKSWKKAYVRVAEGQEIDFMVSD